MEPRKPPSAGTGSV